MMSNERLLKRLSGYFLANPSFMGQEMLSKQMRGFLCRFQRELELLVGCSVCAEPLDESTYIWQIIDHQCPGEILLARVKGTPPHQGWRKIRRRPIFPTPRYYRLCQFYRLGIGCTRHDQCTFASSLEEAMVWTFERQNYIPRLWLKAEVQNSSYHWTPESQRAVGKIEAEFGGYFQEICKACFETSPSQVTHWGPNLVCPEHPYSDPILVHVASQDQLVVIKPKPRRRNLLEYCKVRSRRKRCQRGATACTYAHSDVEMAVWEAEAGYHLRRPDLIRTTLESAGRTRISGTGGGGGPAFSARPQVHCQACSVSFGSQVSFKNHCFSPEHKLRASYDQGALWRHRRPVLGVSEFKLCPRKDICLYGDVCIKAHSLEELQEWILRALTIQMSEVTAWKCGLLFFQDQLFHDYQDSDYEALVKSRSVHDITIHCGQPLQHQEEEKKSQCSWKFIIHSKKRQPLRHVALLKQHIGAKFSLVGPGLPPGQLYAQGSKFRVHGAAVMTFHVEVHMEYITPGNYDQWVAFDFGHQPALVQKLHMQVDQKEAPEILPTSSQNPNCLLKMTHWNSGDHHVVTSMVRTAEQTKLLAKYNVSSQQLDSFKLTPSANIPITLTNYRDRMHQFLYVEEDAQQQLGARLNLWVQGSLSSKVQTSAMGMKFEAHRKYHFKGQIPCSLTPDTDQGFVLSRAISTAYVAPIPAWDNQVYEVQVNVKKDAELTMWLLLPAHCSVLGLEDGDCQLMEIQFQIDKMVFRRRHQAIDALHDETVVVPDIPACSLPSPTLPTQKIFCNAKQKQVISYITGTASQTRQVPSLLIYGPFGTGKTYTLAWAALEVIKQPNAKVLICTHTDSAADVYIREYFYVYISAGHPEAMPLRIKHIESFFHETDPTTLQYCCLSEDGCSFHFSTQDELEQHPIIVPTTTASHSLHVPPDFFPHILIDEAAQMLECEAIMPLAYTAQDTGVALAGDHLQSTLKVFSVGDRKSADHSLFNRLFQYYQQETHQLASQCRIVFRENYRTTETIIPFVLHNFYGTSKILMEDSGIPDHPWQFPLMFCCVSGTPEKNISMTSRLNRDEIVEVIKRIQEFYQDWDCQWGSRDQKQICVVSHGSQVKRLKEELRKKQLEGIVVENSENMPGREFQVVILSTIHTQDSLFSNSATHLEFFSEPRLLNTMMTRDQSQLVVVGDPSILCAFGHFSEIWKRFIQRTLEQGNTLPSFLKMEDMEPSSLLHLAWQNRLDPGTAAREDLEEEDNYGVATSQASDAILCADDSILEELLAETLPKN